MRARPAPSCSEIFGAREQTRSLAGTAEMRRSSWALALVVVGGLGLLGAGSAGSLGCGKTLVSVPVSWETDIDLALRRAKKENKPVVVYFGASWDTAAKELEHETFTDPEVRLLLARDFVSVHVDSSDDEDPYTQRLQKEFKVVGDPTIVIVAADGTTELRRINEFVTPAVFAYALRLATLPDAVRESRFEAEARARADEARWEEERRKADLAPTSVTVISIPDPP
jgi:thiol:disulfide interchange protein